MPVLNEAAALQSYREDRLRIISEEQFEAVKAKLAGRKLSTSGQARSADLIRVFTGHLFCEQCGSAFYAKKSGNRKGAYIYYQCGCRQRKGPEACSNSVTLREDKLLRGLQEVCALAFSDIDGMVEMAIEEAQQAAKGNRLEAERIRGELAQVDRELATIAGLMVDPDVMAEPMAKKTILRKAAEVEGRREGLQGSLAGLLDKANEDTGRLAATIRRKLLEAKERWEAIASPAQLNQVVGDFVGPPIVTSQRELLEVSAKENPTYVAVRGVVEGR